MQDRVCFFSEYDLSVGYHLELAEKRVIEIANDNIPQDLEGIIELWHIRRFIESDCKLLRWSDEDFARLKSATEGYKAIIARFFNCLNPQTIKDEFEALEEYEYQKTFWQIIDSFNLYKIIFPEVVREILSNDTSNLRDVLCSQGVVEKFKVIIREELLSNEDSACILLGIYVAKRDAKSEDKLYLPSNLSLEDKEQIINKYLDSKRPNLNYVRLITQVKNDKNKITLSPKTRLKAKRLADKLNKELLDDPRTSKIRSSVNVCFSLEEGIPPLKVDINEQGIHSHTYSVSYVKSCDNQQRILYCGGILGWLNNHFLLNLINKKTEVGGMENLFMDKGIDSYPANIVFNKKEMLSQTMLYAYDKVLQKLGSSFVNELKQYYEEHLRKEYDYPSLVINFPLLNDSFLNKCRVLCPELDAIVKQYNTFIEYDEIDEELIRLSSPLKVEEGKSFLTNKYYDINIENKDIDMVLRGLFNSGNYILHYVEPFKGKGYHSLVELLEQEETVLYSNYSDRQKTLLDILIQQEIISVNPQGYLYIVSKTKIEILESLWIYKVCSYWHYDDEGRKILDEYLAKGWLVTDDHLLSSPEREYFSYYLDNMMFTNGKAYRNHYVHGSTTSVDDENEHLNAYYTFLKLLVILLLKIEDDLWLSRRAMIIDLINRMRNNNLLELNTTTK